MRYAISAQHAVALDHLSGDPFSSLIALKMLTLYPDACRTTTLLDRSGWACLTEMDVAASAWDRQAYPSHRSVVLLDGNSEGLLGAAFDRAPRDASVFKVHDPFARALVASLPGCAHACSYLSYSTPAGLRPAEPREHPVRTGTSAAEEVLARFAEGGHSADEIGERLSKGGAWFALSVDGRPASVCYVFPNYGRIWEVAGLFTVPEHRRKGYARAVVSAALGALSASRRVPRYQLRDGNLGSRAVAESLGLELVLTVDHYTTPGLTGAIELRDG